MSVVISMAFLKTVGGFQRDAAILEEVGRQEDRGAAIIAGAFLEDFLFEAISSWLVDDKKALKGIFEGTGPLATFSAKIEMAYLMGLMSKRSHSSAAAVRKIRNEFAHNMGPLRFETPLIKGKCQSLMYQREIRVMYQTATQLFERHGNMTGLLQSSFSRLIDLEDTPRNAYINTVMVHSVILQRGWRLDETGKIIFPQKVIDEIQVAPTHLT
jgi:DNA-binding MltR family transcriptional regulator